MAEATDLDTLQAAQIWRDRCLILDKSLFQEDEIWNMVNLRALWVALTCRDEDLRRLESLGDLLREVDAPVVRLAAECFWLLYLAAGKNCISSSRKAEIVLTISEWSGESLSPTHPLLKDITTSFNGGPGLFFSARRTPELRFLIKAVVNVKKLTTSERQSLLSDPWSFARSLDEAAGNEELQLNHILRHLLFPDTFEPVFTRRDKRRIVESFSGIPRREVRRLSAVHLDEEIATIRRQLQTLYEDAQVSFFQEPLISTWRRADQPATLATGEQRFWVEKTSQKNRPDRTSGSHQVGKALWAPTQAQEDFDVPGLMRDVEPGDVVFHLTDDVGFTGVSVVSGALEEDFVCPDGSAQAGQPGLRIELDQYMELNPPLSQRSLLRDSAHREQLRQLATSDGSLFFNRQLTLNRGRYLTTAPEPLVRILDEACYTSSNRHLPHVDLPEQDDMPAATELTQRKAGRPARALLLQGPSATGKTFTAVARAVELCDGVAPGNVSDTMERYQQLADAGRICLITFHPGYSYAQFVERCQDVPEADPETGAPRLTRIISPGILKAMARRAASSETTPAAVGDLSDSVFWKVSCGDNQSVPAAARRPLIDVGGNLKVDYGPCTSRQQIREQMESVNDLVDEERASTLHQIVNRMSVDDLVILTDETARVLAIGRITGGYSSEAEYDNQTFRHIRPVEWLASFEEPRPWHTVSRKEFQPRPLYRLENSLLRTDELSRILRPGRQDRKNHVLIIDEIGRGDIDAVFGEITTLIDIDPSGITPPSVHLALSGEQFSLPENFYIVATLNTAEPTCDGNASILSRRFSFEDVPPDPSMIRGNDEAGTIPDQEGGRIDLRKLMLALNQRIEAVGGREQLLGQGMFMHIRSYEELLGTLRSRIMPRLVKIFDGDWRAVQRILRDIEEDGLPASSQIVGSEDVPSPDGAPAAIRYWINPDRMLSAEAIRKVYAEA